MAEYKVLRSTKTGYPLTPPSTSPAVEWKYDEGEGTTYLKAPSPWEKMMTGYFSLCLNGASRQAGTLKEPEIDKQDVP